MPSDIQRAGRRCLLATGSQLEAALSGAEHTAAAPWWVWRAGDQFNMCEEKLQGDTGRLDKQHCFERYSHYCCRWVKRGTTSQLCQISAAQESEGLHLVGHKFAGWTDLHWLNALRWAEHTPLGHKVPQPVAHQALITAVSRPERRAAICGACVKCGRNAKWGFLFFFKQRNMFMELMWTWWPFDVTLITFSVAACHFRLLEGIESL